MAVNKSELYDLLAKYSQAWGQKHEITKERLMIYVEMLDRTSFTMEQITIALRELAYKSKFFPSIAEIVNTISPEIDESDAVEKITGRIIEIASSMSAREAHHEIKNQIGEIGSEAVAMVGGINSIGQSENISVTHAHLKKSCYTAIKTYRGRNGRDDEYKKAFSIASEPIKKMIEKE